MTIDNPRLLRDAFGAFMTGVTVVTTVDSSGAPVGFTANSFSSVSLEPPLLLVSIAKTSASRAAFVQGKGFAVNILSDAQKEVSNTFARPIADRFGSVRWQTGSTGAPLIDGVSAWFDCSLYNVVDAGDHDVLIGKVEAFDANQKAGLGYYRGAYFTPTDAAEAVNAGPHVVISAIVEANGSILLVDDGRGGLSLPMTRVDRSGTQASLNKLIAEHGVTAAPGFIYSFYEDTKTGQQNIAFLCSAATGDPSKGAFVPLSQSGMSDVTDPAIRTMLERLATESEQGMFGVYVGDQDAGRVSTSGIGKP